VKHKEFIRLVDSDRSGRGTRVEVRGHPADWAGRTTGNFSNKPIGKWLEVELTMGNGQKEIVKLHPDAVNILTSRKAVLDGEVDS
jgi:hypothetical protein